MLAVDGQTFHPLEEGQEVRLRRHPVSYPLYAMAGLDPYRRLRERLGWGGSLAGIDPQEPGKAGRGDGSDGAQATDIFG